MKKKMILNGQPIEVSSALTIEPGDGLSKNGNILNIDNSVRGIYTQAEFDALTEEQKASGTYFVDDGQGGSGGGQAQDIYSIEERVVGRWIDGRPLYRRVYTFTMPTNTDQYKAVEYGTEIKPVMFKVYCTTSDAGGEGYAFIPAVSPQSQVHTASCWIRYGSLWIQLGSGSVDDKGGHSAIFILEYTKTTDQATIELPAALTAAPIQAPYKTAPQSAVNMEFDSLKIDKT